MRHDINPDRILIVDDERDVAEFLKSAARSLGFLVRTANSFETFSDSQLEFEPTVVLVDLEMPGHGARDYLKLLSERQSTAQIILAGGLDRRATARAKTMASMLGLNLVCTLRKPLPVHVLRQELRKLLEDSRLLTTTQLAAAIKAGEIRPHYQPKLSRDNDGHWAIREAEALARWYRLDGSIVMPDHFIGLAEDGGLMTALTDSMLQQVALQLRRWARQGIHLRVAVNLPPSLLAERALPDRLEALLREYGVANEQLILETSEQLLAGYTPAVIDVLQRLSDANFGLAIDNFGTGAVSPELLYRMPFDEIKLDRSFMQRCHADEKTWPLVEAIVQLGRTLGKKVCAEGVDSRPAFNRLSAIACDKQQGFLVGKPVPGINLKFLHNLSNGDPLAAVAPVS